MMCTSRYICLPAALQEVQSTAECMPHTYAAVDTRYWADLEPIGDVDAVLLDLWVARCCKALNDQERQDVKAERVKVSQGIHYGFCHFSIRDSLAQHRNALKPTYSIACTHQKVFQTKHLTARPCKQAVEAQFSPYRLCLNPLPDIWWLVLMDTGQQSLLTNACRVS